MPPGRLIDLFLAITLATGLLLPGLLGLIVRALLAARGVPVVSLAEGAHWVFPLTLFSFLPFGLLALTAHFSLKRASRDSPAGFAGRLHLFAGALIGMALALGYLLAGTLQSIRDVADMAAFWPFTVVLVFIYALAGGLPGAAIGWLTGRLRHRRRSAGADTTGSRD